VTSIEQATETTTGPDLAGLRMVLAAVEQAPANELDMGRWGDCGTAACAIGWFCRENPYDRLRMSIKTYRGPLPCLDGNELGCDAIGLRFGLSRHEVDLMFGDLAPRKKWAVIERLEQFIVDRE
jgi:hypothetical protein